MVAEARLRRRGERLDEPFDITRRFTVPIGDYHFNEYSLRYSSNNSTAVAGNIQYRNGTFYHGTKQTLRLGATYRPNYRLTTSLSYELNDIEFPDQGAFTIHLVGVNMKYAFNSKAFVTAFVQYNNDTNRLSSNIRFRLIHRPLSDLYLVYNDVRDHLQDLDDREFVLKYTYLFDF